MQLLQEDLSQVKGGEADPHCNGPFDPVHTEAFIESSDSPLLEHDLPHGAQDGAVRVTRYPRRLHAPPYHVQRVGRRLTDEARTGPKSQPLIRVGLWAPTSLCIGGDRGKSNVDTENTKT